MSSNSLRVEGSKEPTNNGFQVSYWTSKKYIMVTLILIKNIRRNTDLEEDC